MKNPIRSLFLSLAFGLTASAYAGLPALNITVADATGKVAYKGQTAAKGTFTTAALPAGDYTVQLKSGSRVPGNYEVALGAGRQKVASGTVSGAKFGGGGVAMRIKLAQSGKIEGQVFAERGAASATSQAAGAAKVKVVNGKRYVWVSPETGSNIPGRWVEEGSEMQSQVIKGGAEALGSIDNKGGGR